jgi:hypothetical protein
VNQLIKETKDRIDFIVPTCKRCNKLMGGFFYKFYKEPNSPITESLKSVFFTDIFFQCGKCNSTKFLTDLELVRVNDHPLNEIGFPPGFDENSMRRATKLTTK